MSRMIDNETIEALANSVFDRPEHKGKLLPKPYVVNQVCSELNSWALLNHVNHTLSQSDQFVLVKGASGGFGRAIKVKPDQTVKCGSEYDLMRQFSFHDDFNPELKYLYI